MPRRRMSTLSTLMVTMLALAGLGPARGWTSWSLPDSPSASLSAVVDHLLVSEVVTGGAAASDEFIEIYNPAGSALPLEGLELVYVSASGATVTRKAAWEVGAAEVPPGAHILVANEAGVFASIADHLYANGLAATGGSVALRIQGAVTAIDAVGWGTAASSWLEGTPAPAPPAGSSLERLPGGTDGSGQDTDDNASDFVERVMPDPQNSGSPPIPIATPAPSPSAMPTPTPAATQSVAPTASPTPTNPPSPTPFPTPSPTPSILTISAARALPDGAIASIEGTALTDGTFTDGGGYLQDASGGIAVLVTDGTFARGARLRVTGQLDDRYHQRTLRTTSAQVELLGSATDPAALAALTGEIGEGYEGTLVRIRATVTSSVSQLSNGVAFDVDDGSGPTRLVIYDPTGIDSSAITRGLEIEAIGVVGQRDSSGTGSAGYRVQPRDVGDVIFIGPPASPQPSGTPGATPSVSPSPSGSPGQDGIISIAAAREAALNATLRVRGIVTLPSSVLGDGTAAIQDASGAIILRLGDEAGSVQLGEVVLVSGRRSTKSGMATVHASSPPERSGTGSHPLDVLRSTGQLGEADEALLVMVRGAITSAPRRTSAENVYFDVDDGSGPARVFISPRTGISTDALEIGAWVEVRGVLGQETSGQQPLRGYRLWPRMAADIRLTAAAGDSSTAPGGDRTAGMNGTGPAGSSDPVGGPGSSGHGMSGAVIDLPVPRLAPPRTATGPTPRPTPKPRPVSGEASSGVDSAARSTLGLTLLLVTVLAATGGVAARRPGLVDRIRASFDRLTGKPAGDEAAEEAIEPGQAATRLVPLHAVDDPSSSVRPSVLSTIRDHDGRILPPT